MTAYPSPPGLRVPYDRDGSVGFWYPNGGSISTFSAGAKAALNNETFGNNVFSDGSATDRWGFIFPRLWDLKGWFLAATATNGGGDLTVGPVEYSTDTTTGADGTWTQIVASTPFDGAITPNYRTDIQSHTQAGIKAIRFTNNTAAFGHYHFSNSHIYAEPSASQIGGTLKELWPWKPDGSGVADGSTGDFGDPSRGNQYTLTIKFKNVHGSLTARNVLVAGEALTDFTPSLLGQFQYSLDTINWYSVLPVGDIAPGGLSPLIYIRDAVAGTSTTGPKALRAVPSVSSWS